jgi:ketosteroid isomerase-like protein
MTDRLKTEKLLHDLYAARSRGDLDGICATFTPDAKFQIAGASLASPMAITANGVEQFRPLLAIMIKTLPHSDQRILSMLIDGAKAAVHWRVKIFSRITGATVLTELIDMIEVRDGRIASFTELFAPASAATG